MDPDTWLATREADASVLMASGAFPNVVRVFAGDDRDLDLDQLLEFGLQRFLDGVDRLLPG